MLQIVLLAVIFQKCIAGIADVCNSETKTCCVWNDTDIADILDSISSGWTLLVDPCGRKEADAPNGAINVPDTTNAACQNAGTNAMHMSDVYITAANTAIRSMRGQANPVPVKLDWWDYASEVDYSCSAFIVQAPQVTIEYFVFDISGCVTTKVQDMILGGKNTVDVWSSATPIVARDKQNDFRQTHFSYLTLSSGGDAVARFIPHNEGDTINMDGSQFSNIVGKSNVSSPVVPKESIANNGDVFGIILGVAEGIVTLSGGTKAVGFGGPVVGVPVLGQWLGIQPKVSPPTCVPSACPKAPACPPVHPESESTVAIAVIGIFVATTVVIYLLYVIFDRIGKLDAETSKNKTE